VLSPLPVVTATTSEQHYSVSLTTITKYCRLGGLDTDICSSQFSGSDIKDQGAGQWETLFLACRELPSYCMVMSHMAVSPRIIVWVPSGGPYSQPHLLPITSQGSACPLKPHAAIWVVRVSPFGETTIQPIGMRRGWCSASTLIFMLSLFSSLSGTWTVWALRLWLCSWFCYWMVE
jgi:hypothetical protein